MLSECSAAHGSLSGTTRPCRIKINFFGTVHKSFQNCSMQNAMEMVDDSALLDCFRKSVNSFATSKELLNMIKQST